MFACRKHSLNSPRLIVKDTSCSLISCLQLCSRSHLLLESREKLATAKAIPPAEVLTPSGPLMEHRIPALCPPPSWQGMVCPWTHHTHQKDCKPPSHQLTQNMYVILTYQHPGKPRNLMSVTLGPSSWLTFRVPQPLEHSSATENKLTTANSFINYQYPQNIHPSFKYSQSKELAVSYLRNLKQLISSLL